MSAEITLTQSYDVDVSFEIKNDELIIAVKQDKERILLTKEETQELYRLLHYHLAR